MTDHASELRPPSDGRHPIVVLLVDDQRLVGAAMTQLLGNEPDIELHCCEQALQAIAMANRVTPTVILQDLFMPDIDGLTLLGQFRENPVTAATPIVVLSGNDDAATRARALAAGAADYLVKLPAKADLIACIRRYAAGASEVMAPIDASVIAMFREAGSPDFTRSVIDQFNQEAGRQVRALCAAAASADCAAVTAVAHGLKGSSMIMGARRLAALCAQVEVAVTVNSGVIAPALLLEIDKELVRVCDALASLRPDRVQP